MRTKHFSIAVLVSLCFFVTSGFINETLQKKIIRTKDYDFHFFVSLKEKKTTKDRMYFWFKSGEVHHSFGDAGGLLLHDTFLKYYRGNILAEKGILNYGLKVGTWKSWYENGHLKEIVDYKGGQKSGVYEAFSDKGMLVVKGKYSNGIKDGVWIDFIKKDTIWHKKGKEYSENPRVLKKRQDSIAGKQPFFKRLFKKKDSKKVKNKKENKPSFFKRLFSKNKKA